MTADPFSDSKIVESWAKNARPWTAAVRGGRIDSRTQVTDQAVLDAILDCSPRTVLDVGCGEGWLLRELATRNIQGIGVDVVPALIDAAQRAGGGEFRVMPYEALAAGEFRAPADVMVCNFSLLGKESVEGVLRAAPSLLNPGGALIVQTLHPIVECGDLPYRDGWREGSWAGIGDDFTDPGPWYFRTFESWIRLVMGSGMRLRGVREPIHPKTLRPASVIMIGERTG